MNMFLTPEDHRSEVLRPLHWRRLRSCGSQFKLGFTPVLASVVLSTGKNGQSEALVPWCLLCGPVGAEVIQWGLSLVERYNEVSYGGNILNCALQSVLMSLIHWATVIQKPNGDSLWWLVDYHRE